MIKQQQNLKTKISLMTYARFPSEALKEIASRNRKGKYKKTA